MLARIDLRHYGVVLGIAASACAAPEVVEEEADTELAIIGGKADLGHPAVGMLAQDPDGDGAAAGFCTGTLIAPTKVLTAAHCVDDKRSATRLYVMFAPSTGAANRADVVSATSAAIHPNYQPTARGTPNDVAIVTLASAPRGITPLPFAREPITAVGATITHVGFGHSSATGTQDATGLGTKRVISTPLLGIEETKLITGRALCFGDSGGPALMTVRGVTRVVGVHSYITNPSCNSPSTQGASERLHRVLAFIDANLGDAPRGGAVQGTVTAMGYGANLRAEPNTSSRVVTAAPDGAVLTITCQARGERVAGTDVWDYIGDRGGWVLDQLVDTGVDGFHPSVPRCE